MSVRMHPITGRRVLLAEDDYFIATNMQSQFEGNGAHVLGPVPSVRAALALIAATPEIDAAVLDVNLQEEMVFPVADVLAARGVPFLFVTGYERTIIPERFAHVRHCVKPVESIRLVRLLSLLCRSEATSADRGGTTTRPE